MKDIAIYGAGGLGREVAISIELINKRHPEWNLIGFFDDSREKGSEVARFGKILGGIEGLNSWQYPINIVLCFGNPLTLKKIRDKITNDLVIFPNIICPSCWFGDWNSITLGEGNIIQGDTVFTTAIEVGNFNVFNGNVNVGHDVKIGDYNVIMPKALISGEVTIGNQNLFGANCFIKQQLKIGNNVTVTPLSALLTKPKDEGTYIGNPAKLFKF